MPAKSKNQAIAARIARGIQKGEVKPKAGTASAQMAKMPASSLKHFTKTEGKCSACGGDGWYVEPDEKGEPQQVQCSTCQGQSGHKDPEPRIRTSGEPENEPFFESEDPIKLGDIVKEMQGRPAGMSINGKQVDPKSIEIDGVDTRDYPDFSDAYISKAKYVDSTPLTDREIEQLEKENYGLVNDLAHNQIMQENWDWRDDPKIARDFEKSDVSQDEFERSRGYGRYSGGRGRYSRPRPAASPMRITFFNVPAGKESEASKAGLTQFKSGKWGFKHNFDPQVVSVASDREKSAVSDAEKIFGKGRYWQPKN